MAHPGEPSHVLRTAASSRGFERVGHVEGGGNAMQDEPTSTIVTFSRPRDPDDGATVQISLGAEDDRSSASPYSFTIMIANVGVSLIGAPEIEGHANVVERVPLSEEDMDRLRRWLDALPRRKEG